MSKQASGPVIKLSVFGAVGDAFRGVFENLGAAVVAGLFPLILLVAIQTVSFLIAPSGDTGSFFGELAFSLIGLIPYAVFAVTWHRFILMGPKERPSVLPAFARTHARFFMFSVILFLLVIVPIIAITAVTGAGAAMFGATQGGSFDIQAAQSAGIGAILIIIYLVLAAYFYGRLSLVLPASAVGEEGYTFAWAWRHSRGNGFKIMLAFIVMGIALGVIAAVYFTIAGLLLSGLAASGNVVSTIVLGAAILSPAYIIMTALFISLLSVIFQELSGYQPPWERE